MEDDTNMAQEQEDQANNNGINGGGGGGDGRSSSKKPKQKKAPQRGLGVAQLEKILHEQHKKDGNLILPSHISGSQSSNISHYLPHPISNFNYSNISQNSASSSSNLSNYLPLPIANFNHINQNSSTNPLASLPPLGDFRSSLSMQHMDGNVSSTVPLNNSGGVFGNAPNFWRSHELNIEKESFGVENGMPFLRRLPFESNPNWPLHNWVQRTPQFQHQNSAQVVNNSSGTSSSHVPQMAIEPPSNQISSSNGMLAMPAMPAEKMTNGMKRSYPFSLDFPQAPAFKYNKLHPFGDISANGRTSCEGESGLHFDAGNSTSRESLSCSASNSDPNSKKKNTGIKDLDGSFLTLATPSSSKPVALNNQECLEFQSPIQENIQDQFPTPPGYRELKEQRPTFYDFFHIAAVREAQNGQTTARIQNGDEMEETSDLDLKL